MDNITRRKYFLTEAEIMKSLPYKQFIKLLMTKGSVLSSRVEDNVLFEFARIDVDPGLSYTLVTTNSRIWCLATAFTDISGCIILYAFNKDIVEELENGQE